MLPSFAKTKSNAERPEVPVPSEKHPSPIYINYPQTPCAEARKSRRLGSRGRTRWREIRRYYVKAGKKEREKNVRQREECHIRTSSREDASAARARERTSEPARHACLGVNADGGERAEEDLRAPARRKAARRYASLRFQRKAAFGKRRAVVVTTTTAAADEAASRSRTHRPPAAGYRAGAGRPAGRLQQLYSLSRTARYIRAFRELPSPNGDVDIYAAAAAAPMPRRQLRYARKQVEAISGSDTTLFQEPIKIVLPSRSLAPSRSLFPSICLFLALSVALLCVLSPSAQRARTMYSTAPCQTRAHSRYVYAYIYGRMHTYIDTWRYSPSSPSRSLFLYYYYARAILFLAR